MVIGELAQNELLGKIHTNSAPFVEQYQPLSHTTAPYWINVFGAIDESSDRRATILSIIINYLTKYGISESYDDCVADDKTFFVDLSEQIIYIHYDHNLKIDDTIIELGTAIGMTDSDVIYIDGVEYLPLINSIPSIKQKQDLVNYPKLTLLKGNVVLNNIGSKLNYLIDRNVYGQDFILSELDIIPGVQDYSRTDLKPKYIAYVDDYDISLQEIFMKLGDKRDSNDIDIPIDKFLLADYPYLDDQYVDEIIPVAWGPIFRSTAIPTNSETTGNVVYRQALLLTSLGTVQVKIDEAWVTKVPISTNLSIGSFTLAAADSRNSSDVPHECRVENSIGIAITYISDIIKDWNYRYLGIDYIASNYDITEWESEELGLSSAGLLLTEKIKMYDAIALLQNGANVGFRYDIKPGGSGKSTIRIDDFEREISYTIDTTEIGNIDVLPVKSNKELLVGTAIVKYSKDYDSGKFLQITDDSEKNNVIQAYRKITEQESETFLQTESQAETKATWILERFSTIPKLLEVELVGKQFSDLRLFDTIKIPITPENVDFEINSINGPITYYGIWKAIIYGTDPDENFLKNTVTVRLISQYEQINTILSGNNDSIIIVTETGSKIIIHTGD